MIGRVRSTEILDGAPGLSRSVQSQRLRRPERDGVVERRDGGYPLTESGHELAEAGCSPRRRIVAAPPTTPAAIRFPGRPRAGR